MSPPSDFVRNHWFGLLLLILLFGCPATGWSVTRYVSTTGSDSNNGTSITTPWRTINKAATSTATQPGDLIYIRGGTYAEMVSVTRSGSNPNGSGTNRGYITFQSYPGETAIIDGSTLTPLANTWNGLIQVHSRNYLIFRDLELRGLKTAAATDSDVMGFLITGTSSFIELRNCKVHGIHTLPPANGIANGIGVYGTNATIPISSLVVDGCEIYDLKTSSSESVTFNGNVDGFQMTNCQVHDCDNIGIDCIGFEGMAAGALDQARNGLIARNLVYNIDSITNPAYNNERGAGGIYVDGGKLITIEGNTVHHCNIGIEVASEALGKVASDCVVRDNFIYQCHRGGIFMGGASSGSNGGTTNCQILNNSLWSNDTDSSGGGEIAFQWRVTNVTIRQNILYPLVHTWGSSLFIQDPRGTATDGHVIQRNLYYSVAPSGSHTWQWRGIYYNSFSAWKTGSGQDSLSTFSNPQYTSTNAITPNLHLLASSPARNAGDSTFVGASGELEIDAQARIAESVVDLGADEFVPTITISSTDPAAAEWGVNTASGTLTRSTGNVSGASLTVALTITGTASNGVDYPTLSSVTIPAGSLSANFTITPAADTLAEGPETILISPGSVSGAYLNGSANPISISLTDRPYQQWQFTHFGSNANSPSIAGDNADPDKDARPNLLEYATGTLPLTVTPGDLLAVSRVNGYLTANLARSASPVDVTLTPQVSSDCSNWLATPNLVILINSASQLQFRDASLTSANLKRFLRVKVDP